jgi:hypothetical protein
MMTPNVLPHPVPQPRLLAGPNDHVATRRSGGEGTEVRLHRKPNRKMRLKQDNLVIEASRTEFGQRINSTHAKPCLHGTQAHASTLQRL